MALKFLQLLTACNRQKTQNYYMLNNHLVRNANCILDCIGQLFSECVCLNTQLTNHNYFKTILVSVYIRIGQLQPTGGPHNSEGLARGPHLRVHVAKRDMGGGELGGGHLLERCYLQTVLLKLFGSPRAGNTFLEGFMLISPGI